MSKTLRVQLVAVLMIVAATAGAFVLFRANAKASVADALQDAVETRTGLTLEDVTCDRRAEMKYVCSAQADVGRGLLQKMRFRVNDEGERIRYRLIPGG